MPPISPLALIYINDHCEHGMLLHISRSKQDFAHTSSHFRRMRAKSYPSSRQVRQFFPASLTKIAEKALVKNELRKDPFTGTVFVFR